MASIATASICILTCVPQDGFCLVADMPVIENVARDILSHAEAGYIESIPHRFSELKNYFDSSADPVYEGRKLLQSFVDEINTHYGLSLTMTDACQLVKERLHLLQIPPESQGPLLLAIELLGSEPSLIRHESLTPEIEVHEAWHWHWYWPFGKKKNEKAEEQRNYCNVKRPRFDYPGPIPPDSDLPPELILGGVESLAGALLLILPFGVTQVIGGILVADGVRRVLDGSRELDWENRRWPEHPARV